MFSYFKIPVEQDPLKMTDDEAFEILSEIQDFEKMTDKVS